MDLRELQDVIERTFGDRDRARGVPASVAWLAEEVGELAQAVRKGTHVQRVGEFGAFREELSMTTGVFPKWASALKNLGASTPLIFLGYGLCCG